MISAISSYNSLICESLENSLTPIPQDANHSRVLHHLTAAAFLPIALVTFSLDTVCKVISYVMSFFCKTQSKDPQQDFTAILTDSRNWEKIQSLDVRFDPDFLFGTATCTFQDSGAVNCPNSQWTMWEKKVLPENNRSGKSANLFEMYQTGAGRKEIVSRLKKMGANSYRFSIEWSQIEPEPGKIDELKLRTYVNFCKYLQNHGIKPVVTLHHFSEPKWFHELGSFEKEENIKYFISFIENVGPKLAQNYWGKPLVPYICTVNEPAIEAFSRYIRGAFSPGYHFNFFKAGHFLKNALKAHCIAYPILKKMNPNVQVGIVHQRLSLIPTNPLIGLVTRYINRLVNETTLEFFKTKIFNYKIPFCCNIVERGLDPKCDFVGLQYYTRPIIGMTGSTSYYEAMTQMPFREDPEGLYLASLETFDAFKVPVIVTENGISTPDDKQRARYISRALYALRRAQEKIGPKNLLGYYLWSFCDNSEWDMGRHPQAFGAYKLNDDGSLERDPKSGVWPFIKAAKSSAVAAA